MTFGPPEQAPTPATPAGHPIPRQRPAGHTGSRPAEVVPARLGDVVPAPALVEPNPGTGYRLTAGTVIRTDADPAVVAVGEYLAGLLRPATGYPLPVTGTASGTASRTDDPADAITLRLDPETAAGPGDDGPEGGYRLDVTADGVRLRARTTTGLFHGVQTLRQLLPAAIERDTPQAGPWTVPGGRIVDAPRFAYRGAMLDVARHFFGVPDVLRLIDQIARYKLNHLHLHLTDDQGWRIAVGDWPRLAEVGGASEVDGGPGGYYTAADWQAIVGYAASRHVTVVPEIDLPGHTNAALSAYGELAPDGVAPPPYTGTEVGFSSLALDRARTYEFVDGVLGDLAARTPGPYLHIGGDEAFKVPAADYVAFMDRVQRIVAARGKTVVGWHQLAPAAHQPGRVLQWWGTTPVDEPVAEAVRRGARLIMSPGNRAYLDMKYTADTPLGQDWAGLVDVRTAYDWDPGAYLADVPAAAVLGVEAPLWTETIRTRADIEVMAFPRLVAIAELGWSPRSAHDWAGFRARLAAQGPRWDAAGIGYHRAPEVPWPAPLPRPADERRDPAARPELTSVVSPPEFTSSVQPPELTSSVQPPESASSASAGTSSLSRSASQPSGR